MFAMLTGTLPYSVNGNAKNVVTLLHVKMLERKMNPIPSHVSEGKIEVSQSHYVLFVVLQNVKTCY